MMPRPELLTPQGKAVLLGLEHLGLDQVDDVRIGKHITLQLEAETEEIAREKVEKACNKLLGQLNHEVLCLRAEAGVIRGWNTIN